MTVGGPGEEDRRAALLAAYMWCNEAPRHRRKRDHGAVAPAGPREVLPWDIVQAQLPTEPTPDPLLDDDALDAQDPGQTARAAGEGGGGWLGRRLGCGAWAQVG